MSLLMDNNNPDPVLQIRNLSAVFANGNGGLRALENLSFSVEAQQFVCVLGPSGSGKTTLLRILAGLLPPTQGEVCFKGRRLNGPQRGVGFVFQKSNLMPWRTVLENIMLPLELQGIPRTEGRARPRSWWS